MRNSIKNLNENLKYNKERFGPLDNWTSLDQYGYKWGNNVQQKSYNVAIIADKYLKPYLPKPFGLKVLELSPGGGRFTAELIRLAESIDFLDMNQSCLDICKQRFSYYPTPQRFFVNDGISVDMIPDNDYDLVACYDSMVHMHPDIVEHYIACFSKMINANGIMWLDHSGKGARDLGHRTDVTDILVKTIAEKCGCVVLAQHFRNDHDCISVIGNRG